MTAIASPAPTLSVPFAARLGEYRVGLEADLAAFIASKRALALADGDGAGDERTVELIDAVGRLAAVGGKRLRPALVHFSALACGGFARSGGDHKLSRPMELAVELLHTYLLIHDDLMDHAQTRRGEPATQVHFRAAHARRGLLGDGGDYGNSVAILLGDLAHGWAAELANETPDSLDRDRRRQALACFARTGEEVIAGQYLELDVAARRAFATGSEAVTAEHLSRVLQRKSGRYTAERPIQLGALLAGAEPAVAEALRRYGRAVGEAFQLQDDLLGVFGDPARTGKPVGDDLREGKFTFLIFHALAAASPTERAGITSALGRRDLTDDEAGSIAKRLEALGARARVEAMIDERLLEASRAIDSVGSLATPLEPEGEAFFVGLLDHLKEREA